LSGQQRPLCAEERNERMKRRPECWMPMIGRGHLTQAEVEIDRLAMDIKKRNPKINIT